MRHDGQCANHGRAHTPKDRPSRQGRSLNRTDRGERESPPGSCDGVNLTCSQILFFGKKDFSKEESYLIPGSRMQWYVALSLPVPLNFPTTLNSLLSLLLNGCLKATQLLGMNMTNWPVTLEDLNYYPGR
ncbi:hypothetical protein BDQ94DRAFT_135718 [Aspergillus welwitschiae]|uniref:Uncharacterized protein n=1 Tax=Aspergillus welwitschiae TaxID=1341132 RepID=A0A3F3QGT4_9EURO|nr:hypothetical protein BDQ94DRAFT_135718 [Aspergillus welwitschiae]RDH38132.1 hypothetical protein BDQ94DRAFT_135718 [Aspergillus welwitschiae]